MLRKEWLCSCHRWRGSLVVVGGIIIHLSLGTLYTFGNLSPYLTSFMRSYGSAPNLTYTQCAWINALIIITQCLGMMAGGIIERVIGPKLTALLGGWCMSLGVMITFFSVKHSFGLTIFTYGVVFGSGLGVAYIVPLSCAMKWFSGRKGLVNGLVVGGFGCGAFFFNQVQTAFINPDNLKPDIEIGGENYFSQESVLEKVPLMFPLLGGCYAVMQLIGSLLLCNPPTLELNGDACALGKDQEGAVTLVETDQAQFLQASPGAMDNKEVAEVGVEDDLSVHPCEVLRSRHFYVMWFMFLFFGQGTTFITTLYKAYGQTFISDDTFMAIVGSFASLFNASGRVMWGTVADKFSFRVSFLIMCACVTCLMLTLKLSEFGGKPLFLIYICLLFGSLSGSFSLFPTATAKLFGRKYLSVNYGLVYAAQSTAAPLAVLLSSELKLSLGWEGLFFLVAGFSFISFLLTMAFSAKDKNGNDI